MGTANTATAPGVSTVDALRQDLSTQISEFDEIAAEKVTPRRVRDEIESRLLFAPRHLLHGLRICAPEVFERPDRELVSILEIGCGTAVDTVLPLRAAGFDRSVGVDLSSTRVELGRAAAMRLGVDPECVRRQTIQEAVAAEDRFDVVLGQCIVHHFPDYEPLLREVFASLADGGRCLFYEPSVFPWGLVRGRYDARLREVYQRSEVDEIYMNPLRTARTLRRIGFSRVSIFGNFHHRGLTARVARVPGLRLLSPSLFIHAER